MPLNIVVIGGVATGPKAAARARRLLPDAQITIIEQDSWFSYGSCGLPLYLGGLVPELAGLTKTSAGIIRDADYFLQEKDVVIRERTKAVAIDREKKEVLLETVDGVKDRIAYDYLVLATGSRPVKLSVPGNDLANIYNMHHPEDAAKLQRKMRQKIQDIVIVGGGLIGLELVDALHGRKRNITVVEKEKQLLPGLLDPEMASLVKCHLERHKVKVICGQSVTGFSGHEQLEQVITEEYTLPAEAALVAVGVLPVVDLAKDAGLYLGPTGAIAVDSQLRTSDASIFAGGDCIENTHIITGKPAYVPLASTANKHGRVIGSNLAGIREKFSGVLGTTVLKVLDLNIGRTGLTEKEARKEGCEVVTALMSGHDTAHYYPFSADAIIKLVVHKEDGTLLGAQVLGTGEVIKRLDVLAAAITFRANVEQISGLDLGYAPVFASPLDTAIQAANVLRNKLNGLAAGMSPGEFADKLLSIGDFMVLDVRQEEETTDTPVDDKRVKTIPLGQLRARINELPADREILTLCQLGTRSYEAAIILQAHGFNKVKFVEGGLLAVNYGG